MATGKKANNTSSARKNTRNSTAPEVRKGMNTGAASRQSRVSHAPGVENGDERVRRYVALGILVLLVLLSLLLFQPFGGGNSAKIAGLLEQIQRLRERAKLYGDDGAYNRALDKLDAALNALEKLKAALRDDERQRKKLGDDVERLRDKIRQAQRRLVELQKQERARTASNPGDRSQDQLNRQLLHQNRELLRQLQRQRTTPGRSTARTAPQKDKSKRWVPTRDSAKTSTRKVLKDQDVKTKVKDVKTPSKRKADYNKGEDIERD